METESWKGLGGGGGGMLETQVLRKEKENHFNVAFIASYNSRDLVLTFNGTKEALSSVTLYLLSQPLTKTANRAVSVAPTVPSIARAF